MHVVDAEAAAWTLLRDGDALYLEISCNYSAVGYTVLIELDDDEQARVERAGHRATDRIARAVQWSAPIANPDSPYADRDLSRRSPELVESVTAAIWSRRTRD